MVKWRKERSQTTMAGTSWPDTNSASASAGVERDKKKRKKRKTASSGPSSASAQSTDSSPSRSKGDQGTLHAYGFSPSSGPGGAGSSSSASACGAIATLNTSFIDDPLPTMDKALRGSICAHIECPHGLIQWNGKGVRYISLDAFEDLRKHAFPGGGCFTGPKASHHCKTCKDDNQATKDEDKARKNAFENERAEEDGLETLAKRGKAWFPSSSKAQSRTVASVRFSNDEEIPLSSDDTLKSAISSGTAECALGPGNFVFVPRSFMSAWRKWRQTPWKNNGKQHPKRPAGVPPRALAIYKCSCNGERSILDEVPGTCVPARSRKTNKTSNAGNTAANIDAAAASRAGKEEATAAAAAAATAIADGDDDEEEDEIQDDPIIPPVQLFDWVCGTPGALKPEHCDHDLEVVTISQWNNLLRCYPTTFKPLSVHIKRRSSSSSSPSFAAGASPSTVRLDGLDILWDKRMCRKGCFRDAREKHLQAQEHYSDREIEFVLLKEGQLPPEIAPLSAKVSESTDGQILMDKHGAPVAVVDTPVKTRKSTRKKTVSRTSKRIKMDSKDRVAKAMLHCMQEFVALSKVVVMGRIQLWKGRGHPLKIDGTLWSNKVKAGSTLYIKLLKEGSDEIDECKCAAWSCMCMCVCAVVSAPAYLTCSRFSSGFPVSKSRIDGRCVRLGRFLLLLLFLQGGRVVQGGRERGRVCGHCAVRWRVCDVRRGRDVAEACSRGPTHLGRARDISG